MTDKDDKDDVVAKFTPPFEGAYLRNVKRGDLTQADVDAISPSDYQAAFAPNPTTGTPLYTFVEGKAKKAQEKAVDAAEKAADKDDDA
jgi:hypothetical protein